jgi:hypothetical protein
MKMDTGHNGGRANHWCLTSEEGDDVGYSGSGREPWRLLNSFNGVKRQVSLPKRYDSAAMHAHTTLVKVQPYQIMN